MVGKELANSLASSYKGTNPIPGSSTLMTKLLPKGHTSKHHHIGVRVSTYELGKDTNIQSIVHMIKNLRSLYGPLSHSPTENCTPPALFFWDHLNTFSVSFVPIADYYLQTDFIWLFVFASGWFTLEFLVLK